MEAMSALMILLGILEIGWGAVLINRFSKWSRDNDLFFGIMWIAVGLVVIVINAKTLL